MVAKVGTTDIIGAMDRIIKRIVEVADPETIVLFGSVAGETHGPDSDIDLMVIKDGDFRRRSVAQQIYRNLSGTGYPVDVVVVHSEDVARYGEKVGTVIEPALREGRIVYERGKSNAQGPH